MDPVAEAKAILYAAIAERNLCLRASPQWNAAQKLVDAARKAVWDAYDAQREPRYGT